MKVIFISTDKDPWALGLRSISAVLKEAGHATTLVFMSTDENQLSIPNLSELKNLAIKQDVIGLSCLARGSDKARQIINFLRPLNKLIIWGGVHASLNPKECCEDADIVCRGEGEEMMLELLQRLQEGKSWNDIANIVYKSNGQIISNAPRPPIKNLDILPLPDFSFENEYHLTLAGLRQATTIPEVETQGHIFFNGSRGCAFHCTYCCNEKLKNLYDGKNHYIRRMSIGRFIEHAMRLKEIFPKGKYFYFLDEDFAARPLCELKQLAEEYPKKVGMPFECLAHPSRITIPKMELLTHSGMWRVNVGIESGSARTREEVYDRHVSTQIIRQATEIISKYPQVVPYYFLIIGNPYEETADLLESAKFVASLPYGAHLIIYNLVFFPGSGLHYRAIKDGLIKDNHESAYEIDYLTGFQFNKHAWKLKNLYLNGLIYLMGGSHTNFRMGSVPRFLFKILIHPSVLIFNEKNQHFIKLAIFLKLEFESFRHLIARIIKPFFKNPITLYNLKFHLNNQIKNIFIKELREQ